MHVVHLNSTFEEADLRILMHVADCVKNGYIKCTVLSSDTDVIVALLHHMKTFTANGLQELWVRAGTGDKIRYPISTLPEHLHSTFPSYAKLPENTLTEKKNIPFPSLTLITCLTGPPSYPTPFTGRPSHTLSYTTILFLALKVNGRFLESLPVLRLLRLSLSCRCLFSLTFTSR